MINAYRASAGSGKTYTLALKYIGQLLKGDPKTTHRKILAVTFTNDATGEMKERILAELYDLAYPRENNIFLENLKKELPKFKEETIRENSKIALNAILNDYSNFNVTTIDSFFQKIVRNLAKELGIGSRFEIEMDTKMPIKEAVRETINDESNINDLINFVEHKFENEKWSIQRDLEDFGHNIYKENFQKNEEKLLKQLEKEPNKIANLIAECKKIKNEFENKMAEFADRFFAFCAENDLSEADFYQKSKGLPGYFKKIKDKNYADEPNSYAKKESKCNDLLVQTENYRTEHSTLYNSAGLLLKYIHQLKLLNAISQKTSAKNKEENRFILAGANQLLSGLIGEQDSSFVYEKIGSQIQGIIIDEFQDTSELQWKNFRNLISEILASNRFGMLLGDVKQSIYRWRNSDWKILNSITREIPQAKIETLGVNYRSAKNIVEYNNGLFKNAAERIGIETIKTAYCDVAQKNIATESGYVSVHFVAGKNHNSYKTEDSENVMLDEIEKQIETLLNGGVNEGDICILCRKNNQIRKIANRVSNHKIISEEAYQLKSSKEIQMIVSALKVIAEPRDYIAKAEIFLAEGGNINELSKKKTENILTDIDTKLPLYELVETLCRKFKLNGKKECSPFLFAFMDKLADYISKNTGDVKKFLEYWEEKLCEESLPLPVKGRRDGILIMSIHKSKGLQFHSVIVPFVDWAMNEHSSPFKEHVILCGKKERLNLEIMPVEYNEKMENSIFAEEYKAENEAQKMDNLNVLYVALTRAEKNLIVIAREPGKSSLKQQEFKNIQDFIYDYEKREMGEIFSKRKAETESDNPFRTAGKIKQSVFWDANPVNAKIYPSTEAILFARGESGEFVKEGNIIHKIFENISTFDTIENAVQNSASLGILPENKSGEYIEKVKSFILNSGKKEWFSNEYTILNECSIVMKNGGEKRPDRVIVKGNNAIVIDYKTGKEKAEHKRQICEYAEFLSQMGYGNVSGYLWYLTENRVVACAINP